MSDHKVAAAVALPVKGLGGKDAGSVQAAGDLFGAEVQPHMVHATVVWQLNKARAGTHQALTRTLKEGGKKKPFKQKHTGRARAGSSVSPLWVGGASIHGPLPRSYETRVTKRARRQALASALSDRAATGNLVVVDSLESKSGKTKDVLASFKALGIADKSVLVVTQKGEVSFAKAARNIATVSVLALEGLNVYDVLRHEVVLCSKASIEQLSASKEGK